MSDDSFLDPLNRCDDALVRVGAELRTLANALDYVGQEKLAGQISRMVARVADARLNLECGRDMALKTYVSGAEAATVNMVKAALTVTSNEGKQG